MLHIELQIRTAGAKSRNLRLLPNRAGEASTLMTLASANLSPRRLTVLAVIAAACLISLIGFGIRSSFGLYLEPITTERGWSRETFALALAIQNLLWGMGVPVAGAIADRFGTAKVDRAGSGSVCCRRGRHGAGRNRAHALPGRRDSGRRGRRLLFIFSRAGGHRPRHRSGAAFLGVGSRHRRGLHGPGALFAHQPDLDRHLRLVRFPAGDVRRGLGAGPAGVQPAARYGR